MDSNVELQWFVIRLNKLLKKTKTIQLLMIQHTLGVFWHHYDIKIAMTLGIVREKFELQKKLSFSFLL